MLRKTHYDQVPLKPQRVYEEMNEAFDRDTCYVTTIGLSQIAGAQFLHVYKPRNWINCGQAGPLGWTLPAALGVRAADPDRHIVALSGDYDFQFMIEELAVGAQHKLPYLHVVVNNSYLGLIRQSQRGFQMDFEVSLAFDNINSDEVEGYGVDHVAVAEGLGCKAVRVKSPNEFKEAFATAKQLMEEHQVPVVLEFILERVTNISMGTDLHNVSEFEEILCLDPSLAASTRSRARCCRSGRGGAGTLTLSAWCAGRARCASAARDGRSAGRRWRRPHRHRRRRSPRGWRRGSRSSPGSRPYPRSCAYQNRRDRLWITPMLLARTELCAARGIGLVDRAGRVQVADRVGRGGGGADFLGEHAASRRARGRGRAPPPGARRDAPTAGGPRAAPAA